MNKYSFQELLITKELSKIPMVVAIGVFDLVHLGHEEIFKTANEYKNTIRDAQTLAITFDRNPKGSSNLDTLRLREKYLSVFGINSLAVIDFSSEFGKLSASDFIEMLIDICSIKAIVVGDDFHCGNSTSSASAFELKGLFDRHDKDVNVIIKSPVLDSANRKISSTLIREYIKEGKLELVPQFTLRPYQLDLMPTPSIPTGNGMRISKTAVLQLLPPPGLYDGALVFVDGESFDCKVKVDSDDLFITFSPDYDYQVLPPFEKKDYLNLFCRSQDDYQRTES